MGTRTLLGIGPEAIHVMFWQRNCLHFVCVLRLWEVEFKGDGLINLAEETSMQPSIQTVAWLLLDAFSQIYSKSCEQKTEQKGLEDLQLSQEISPHNLGAKERMAAKEISAIKKKSSRLLQHNRKDVLRPSQKLARLYLLQAQMGEGFNSFERLCFEKRALGSQGTT
jgi:hypothetical protein